MEQGPTIQEVVTNITKIVASVGTITTIVSLGMTEFIKRFTNSSKVVAIFALVFGFVAGTLIMKIAGYAAFSPLSLLVSGIASLGAPGLFSVTRVLTAKAAVN
jgi:hypothetical protein